jgi:hypothetical protein
MATPTVLALDLEGTLISNAMSQIPRPGLGAFLQRCRELFPRVVMFTTVREDRFRQIARLLVDEGIAPPWFADVEYIHWRGDTKDLSFIGDVAPEETLLVDDYEIYVHPGQESQWVRIDYFAAPYDESDAAFDRVICELQARLAG